MVIVRLALRLVAIAAVFYLVAHVVPGIHVKSGFGSLLWVAVLFTVVNAVVGPILRLLTLPVIVLTLGLFLVVVNALLLALTAWISSDLAVDNVGAAILGGLIVGVCSWVAELVFPLRKRDHHRDHHHQTT
ncbi:MAG TPA: phage holin family protein [Acidimicrobiales bacterium]|nr:phage holin family protein [Acidimicrobiales bacterium]